MPSVRRVSEHDLTLSRWRWSPVRQAGARPSPRSGMTGCLVRADTALFFGGGSSNLPPETLFCPHILSPSAPCPCRDSARCTFYVPSTLPDLSRSLYPSLQLNLILHASVVRAAVFKAPGHHA